jgi:hypothetical protein
MMGFSRENCIKALSVFADEDFALDWLLSQQENIDNLETKNSQKRIKIENGSKANTVSSSKDSKIK